MVAQVKKYFTKTSDQDWSGVFHDTGPTRTPRDIAGNKRHPDPRDGNPLSESEESTLVNLFDKFVYSNQGFIDLDREYVDDNTLVILYNFETDIDATTYVYKFKEGNFSNNNISLSLEKARIFEEKQNAGYPKYSVRYELCFSNGHVRRIRSEIATNIF